jgi:hypothetical protein
MALVCEALAVADDQIGDTLLWVLSPLWKSGAVDVSSLLAQVEAGFDGDSERGAVEAQRWLGVRP